MTRQEFSVTRTRAAFKPRVALDDLPFFRDEARNVLIGLSGDRSAMLAGSGKTAVAHLPFMMLNERPDASSNNEDIALIEARDVAGKLSIDYCIEGGFNNNCIIVTWSVIDISCCVEWICLKTFTGMQMKYALPGKRTRMVFALADEDAFAYCDKTPCEECGFRCKGGFALYTLVQGIGIVKLSLDRISTSEILGKNQ